MSVAARLRFGPTPADEDPVTFCDAVLVASNNPTGWHRQEVSGSTLFADGHVEVHTWKSVLKLVW